MHNSSDDEIIILSQDDADDITQAVRDLTATIWNALARHRFRLRTLIERPAEGHKVPPVELDLLDELF